jgi:orotidine-5'-phosphate decarboxylase
MTAQQQSLVAARRRLIVALDVPDGDAALAAAGRLVGHVGMIKVGLELFVAEGPDVVRRLRAALPELEVFLDLKLHDIPNTMRGAIRSARALGARFITVHAGSGIAHLRACVEEAGDELGVLAVTVLTSQDAAACAEAGHTRSPAELVAIRAAAARAAGCAGLVCSGQELASVRTIAGDLACVVPGIRPAGGEVGDQKRVMTPHDAIVAGAGYLVVGRPILGAADPVAAADAIVAEMAAALGQ